MYISADGCCPQSKSGNDCNYIIIFTHIFPVLILSVVGASLGNTSAAMINSLYTRGSIILVTHLMDIFPNGRNNKYF